ncbi:MAG: hypothetical protein V1692_00800 [bacterium]
MKNFYYQILSHLPSKKGEIALVNLKDVMVKEGGILFDIRRINDESGEYFVAESTNTKDKQIITAGKNLAELDYNIKDAIFTAFGVPAYYCDFDKLMSPINQEIKLRYATR